MSVREASKDKRRARITQAARVLIHANGTDGFSMRSLAANAGVSVATPYNLFGSKRLVVLSVLQGEIDRFQGRIVNIVEDPLSTLFSLASLLTEQCCEEPTFNRSMLKFLRQEETEKQERLSIFAEVETNILVDVINASKAANQLRSSTISTVLAGFLDYSLSTLIGVWVEGLIADDELEARVTYSFCLATLASATDETVPRLREKMEYQQSRIELLRDENLTSRAAAVDMSRVPKIEARVS